jgi:hypothetical protein
MKTRKLLSKLTEFISADHRAQIKHINSVKDVLEELKNKERKLKEKLKDEKNPEKREEIESKLRVIHAQRKKGITILKEFKQT